MILQESRCHEQNHENCTMFKKSSRVEIMESTNETNIN